MDISKKLWAAKEWARVKASGDEFLNLVHRATNEEKWGPTGQQMEDVCRAFPRGATEIMDEITRRLKHRDKLWRTCYKALLLLDYLARNLSDSYLSEIRALLPLLRNISQSFYFTSGKGIDHGISVRERAKNLADLLSDGLLLRQEREKSAQTKAKLTREMRNSSSVRMYGGRYEESYGGHGPSYSSGGYGDYTGYDPHRDNFNRSPQVPRTKSEQELFDMEMALRLQREEEQRSGLSASQIEKMYFKGTQNRNSEGGSFQTRPSTTDEKLARRLQDEELKKAEAQEALSTGSTSKPTPPTALAESKAKDKSTPGGTEPSAPAAVRKNDILDDLFGSSLPPSAVAGPQTVESLFGVFSGNSSQPLPTRVGPEPTADAWAQESDSNALKQAPTPSWGSEGPFQGHVQPQNQVGGQSLTASAPPQSSWQAPMASAPPQSSWESTPMQSQLVKATSFEENSPQWVQAPMPAQSQQPLQAGTPITNKASASGNMPGFPLF